MKKEVKMYTIECDLCKKQFEDEHNGFVAWTDYEGARQNAIESGWIEDNKQGKVQKHYCYDCYDINDKDEVVNKITSEFLFNN